MVSKQSNNGMLKIENNFLQLRWNLGSEAASKLLWRRSKGTWCN